MMPIITYLTCTIQQQPTTFYIGPNECVFILNITISKEALENNQKNSNLWNCIIANETGLTTSKVVFYVIAAGWDEQFSFQYEYSTRRKLLKSNWTNWKRFFLNEVRYTKTETLRIPSVLDTMKAKSFKIKTYRTVR